MDLDQALAGAGFGGFDVDAFDREVRGVGRFF
jgi:hypothetical protein